MDLGLTGKRALCAGASAGMGKAVALALAGEGAAITLSARREGRLAAATREIADATGASVRPVVADHGTVAGRELLLTACPEPDILIITCSPPRPTVSFREVEPAEWMDSLETALVGPIELMRAVLPGMAARGFGRVVNISTGAAKNPHEMRLLSGPARAALANYSVAIAKRLARNNVTINAVLPGMFDTPGSREMMETRARANGTTYESEVAAFVKAIGIPAGRFGDPADVGAFVAVLCSRYGSFITGQSLVIDGGLTNSVF